MIQGDLRSELFSFNILAISSEEAERKNRMVSQTELPIEHHSKTTARTIQNSKKNFYFENLS